MIAVLSVVLSTVVVVGVCWFLLYWIHLHTEPDHRSTHCPNCRAVLVIPYRSEIVAFERKPYSIPDRECQFCGVLLTLQDRGE